MGYNAGPAWSPDGKALAYLVCGAPALPCTIAIASVETGMVRELRPALAYLHDVKWSKDSRSVKIYGRDLKGRRGLYQVDVQSAEVSLLMEQLQLATWNSTETKVYYRINDRRPAAAGGGPRILERDLSTGAEREMYRHSGDGGDVSLTVSPDDRFLGIVGDERDSAPVGVQLKTAPGQNPFVHVDVEHSRLASLHGHQPELFAFAVGVEQFWHD